MNEALNIIFENRHRLTRQQFKTLKGQCLAGNPEAALKGLNKIIGRDKNDNQRNCTK